MFKIKLMKSIKSNKYFVHFNDKGYNSLQKYLENNEFVKIFILVDENTNKLCLPLFYKKISTNISYETIVIKAGENYKNLTTCLEVWEKLTALGADRKSLLINIGGGVVTDLGGFVASAYKRGIRFINIPTTLLSMVDASVGGKTGVDLGVLKNQIGVFSDPEMVLIDANYLKTVSERELKSGLAEIIKYGLTFDAKLWDEIKQSKNLNISFLNSLIYRSVEIKNDVVLQDPKEANLRKVLNFGHTIGHALESYFLESEEKKSITHGEAIAVGMICETYISSKLFDFPTDKLDEIKSVILRIFGNIPLLKSDYSEVTELLIHDKKNVNGLINFVLLSDIEDFKIDCKVSDELIIESLNYYCN